MGSSNLLNVPISIEKYNMEGNRLRSQLIMKQLDLIKVKARRDKL